MLNTNSLLAHIDEFCIFMNTAKIYVLETKQGALVRDSEVSLSAFLGLKLIGRTDLPNRCACAHID